MIIEIDPEMADKVVQVELVDTYVWLMKDIKDHNKGKRTIHEDDFEIYQKAAAAIEVLGDWFFAHGEFKNAVKVARKKLK
jgi:hypothetical protein